VIGEWRFVIGYRSLQEKITNHHSPITNNQLFGVESKSVIVRAEARTGMD
jgi:hypothetical protein